MQDQLISFETAKLAKEKGCDIKTNKMYCLSSPDLGHAKKLVFHDGDKNECASGLFNWNDAAVPYGKTEWFSVPTQSLLQKWLREKHGIHIYIETTPTFDKLQGNKWKCMINYSFQPFKWTTGHYYLADSYEEVLEIGLKEALKLI